MGKKQRMQKSVTFKLVHNSTTGERVLMMVPPKGKVKPTVKNTVQKMADALPDFIVREDEMNERFMPPPNPFMGMAYGDYMGDNNIVGDGGLHFDEEYDENETEEEKKERLRKTVDGMFPNDGYDYSVHMKEPGEGLFVPAHKHVHQPPQFAPKRQLQQEEQAVEGTVIGKTGKASVADASSSTTTSAVPVKADIRTILVKGARVLDDQLDPEIIAALDSDDEEEDEEEIDENNKNNKTSSSSSSNINNNKRKLKSINNPDENDDEHDFFDNMIKEMNQAGQVDENGVEYFVDEEYDDEEYFDEDEFDDEYDNYDDEEYEGDAIDRQLQHREHFSQEKIDRLEAKKHLNSQFEYLLKTEYGDDEEDLDAEEEQIDNIRAQMSSVSSRLQDDHLDDFIHVTENKRAHKAFFSDLSYEEAVQTIADADLRRIAENLPKGAVLLTEETKRAAWGSEVQNSEIVDINLKRLEHNPSLAESIETLEETEDDYVYMEVDDEEEQKKWDCETILSTYSNLENHPRTISEPITLKALAQKRKKQIQLSQKSGLPVNVLPFKKKPVEESESEEEEESEEEVEMDANAGKARSKKETKEEKALRKKMVKKMKQEKRQQKKALKKAFKTEEQEQSKILTQQHVSRKTIVKY